MVPSGPSTPIGASGGQSVTPSMIRSNSGMMGGQGGPMPSQGAFPSLVSPRTQFNNGNLLGNVPNVSSLLNHSFGNGNASPGIHGTGNSPRGGNNGGAESDPLSGIANRMGFNPPSNMGNPSTSGQVQGQHFLNPSGDHMLPEQSQSQSQQPESQNFQHPQQPFQQFSHQQPFQSIRGGLGGGGPVKSEPQVTGDQHRTPHNQGLGQVKLEQQQLQNMRGIGPGTVKTEAQHSNQSLFLQQQQQQQQQQLMQQMSLSRQNSQAAQMNLLQQQRMLHLQQQQQLLKSIPQQRAQLQPHFSPQNMSLRSPVKSVYEPGMCARRLTHYMYQQQHRPEDNNIEFWRKFVAEYFAPNAKKKWCVSMYGSGRQTSGVFPQDVWHCEICKCKPGRGFEATVEVLPRLFKIKYESGTLEELLYVDMPREYQNSSGQIVLDYAKAIQESVFEQLRVVRDGQLRLVFSPELKICSWEFCARRHEELIPRRLLIPQISQLGTVAQKYQAAAQNSSSSMSASDLQGNCNMFVASARQLAKALEVPLVNDLGYTKRYVRCLQISEVVNSMKDLIDYSRLTGEGPMESLAKFPRRTGTPSALQGQNQQPEEQQEAAMAQNSNNNDQSLAQGGPIQVSSTNGVASVNNSLNVSSSSTSHSTIAGLLHQNSMNSRHQNPMINSNSPYGGLNSVQMLSPGSSTTMPQAQQNMSPLQSPTQSCSNNPPQTSHGSLARQPAMSGDGDTNDTQSSVQKFIQEMMMNNQLNGGRGVMGLGSLGNEVKSGNTGLNGPTSSNSSMGGGPFGGIGGGMGIGQTSLVNGFRGGVGNNSMNGRVNMNLQQQQQQQQHDLGSQMIGGLGAVNGFNGLQFDWKPSP
ncbi:transcriptional corepressor SEUSS-like [Silene latifolia]|uniref:transcriptional corepressor SEUSS-like n=1 Tax=Silene latifolia TaxID=37657 RepID=UPI003D76E252